MLFQYLPRFSLFLASFGNVPLIYMLTSKMHEKEHEFHHKLTLTFPSVAHASTMLQNTTWVYLQHVIFLCVVVRGSLKLHFQRPLKQSLKVRSISKARAAEVAMVTEINSCYYPH